MKFLIILMFFLSNEVKAKLLKLHLTYYPTIEFAGIYKALEKGWYKQAGIDLEIVFYGLNISESLLQNKVDIAMHSAHEVIRQVDQGNQVKAFAAIYQLNPLALATNQTIQKLSDLEGKTVGLFTEQEKDFIRVMLSNAKVDINKIKFITLNAFDVDFLVDGFKSNKYDAIPVWTFNHPVSFALKGLNVRQFPSYNYGFQFYGSVFYAKNNVIKERSKELAKFIKVTQRGWDAVFSNPMESVDNHMKKWYPKNHLINGDFELTKKQQTIQLKLSRRFLYQGVGMEHFGSMTKSQWNSSLNIAAKENLIKNKSIKTSDVFTDSILKLVDKEN